MIVTGVWTGVGFSILKNCRTEIQKFWNRSGVGVWKSDSGHLCHAYGSERCLWPKRLARWWHQQLSKLAPSRFQGSCPHWKCANTTGLHTLQWRPMRDTSKRPKGPKNPHLGGSNREELGWITCVAWKSNKKKGEKVDKGSTYQRQIKHDMHVIGPGWTLNINWQDSSKRREWAIQRLRGRYVM